MRWSYIVCGWKTDMQFVRSLFCKRGFVSWQPRAEHLFYIFAFHLLVTDNHVILRFDMFEFIGSWR